MKNPIAKYLMCAYAYYELDEPLISDTEFDMLGKEILENSGVKLISAENLDDAAKKIVEVIK